MNKLDQGMYHVDTAQIFYGVFGQKSFQSLTEICPAVLNTYMFTIF